MTGRPNWLSETLLVERVPSGVRHTALRLVLDERQPADKPSAVVEVGVRFGCDANVHT